MSLLICHCLLYPQSCGDKPSGLSLSKTFLVTQDLAMSITDDCTASNQEECLLGAFELGSFKRQKGYSQFVQLVMNAEFKKCPWRVGLREMLVMLSHEKKKKKKSWPCGCFDQQNALGVVIWDLWGPPWGHWQLLLLHFRNAPSFERSPHAVRNPSHMERGYGKRRGASVDILAELPSHGQHQLPTPWVILSLQPIWPSKPPDHRSLTQHRVELNNCPPEPTQPTASRGILNGCCFKPISFRVVCYKARDN